MYKDTILKKYFLTACNRYQVLAFATDADERHDTEQRKLSSGKKLVVKPVYFTSPVWTLHTY